MSNTNNTRAKLVVLIVDDNVSYTERMIGMLEEVSSIGYITVATDYTEACRMVAEDKPDLVLLDINLPGKNGIEVLKKIKAVENTSQVIMITNHADEYYRQLCKQMGADYFLDKSIDFGRVPEIISRIHN